MNFERYEDLSGDGGITGYIILKNAIIILFDNGYWYTYNYSTPGREHVEQIKLFAKAGKGLKTYINKYVRDNYGGKSGDSPLEA